MKINHLLKPNALAVLLYAHLAIVSTTSFGNTHFAGRYLSVEEKPKAAQQHLLRQVVLVQFPRSVVTLKEAICFLLQFSGYQLIDSKHLSPAVKVMMRQRLPTIDRYFGPMTLKQSLLTLAGDPFRLMVDPVHRKIKFRLKPQYHQFNF